MTTWDDVAGVVDQLDVPKLARWLARAALPRQRAAALAAAGSADGSTVPGGTVVDPRRLLAALIIVAPAGRVRDGVAVAAEGIPRPAAAALCDWLPAAADRAHGRLGAGAAAATQPGGAIDAAATRAVPRRLVLDDHPALAALPLLALAADMAAATAGGLVVSIDHGAYNGLCGDKGDVGVILLNPAAIVRSGRSMAQTFSHELAHRLDPAQPRWPVELERERFANELGPLLLGPTPATVTEAQPLVDQALAARPAIRPSEFDDLDESMRVLGWFNSIKLDLDAFGLDVGDQLVEG